MAVFGLPLWVFSSAFSALAGAVVYHLVATLLEKQRNKRRFLIELHDNYEALKDAEELISKDSWDGKLHNRYQTRTFDAIRHDTPTLWSKLPQSAEILDLYDRLEYLNDLQNASLIQGQVLEEEDIKPIITKCESLIEDLFPTLKQRWSSIGMRSLELSEE